MIGSLLEGCKLQDRVSHLRKTETRDTKDITLVGHDVCKQLHVTRIDIHTSHDRADFRNDGAASSFNTEHVFGLHDIVGSCS